MRRGEEFGRLTARDVAAALTEDEARMDSALVDTASSAAGSGSGRAGPRVVVVDAADMGSQTLAARHWLLVDVREAEEYAAFHLEGSISFPLTRLRQDRVPAELHAFRHKEDRHLVLVDYEERVAIEVAGRLRPLGTYPNLWVLTGGLKSVIATIPAVVAAETPVGALRRAAAGTVGPGGVRPAVSPLAHLLRGDHVVDVAVTLAREHLPPPTLAALPGAALPNAIVDVLTRAASASMAAYTDMRASGVPAAGSRSGDDSAPPSPGTTAERSTASTMMRSVGGAPMRMPDALSKKTGTWGSSSRWGA